MIFKAKWCFLLQAPLRFSSTFGLLIDSGPCKKEARQFLSQASREAICTNHALQSAIVYHVKLNRMAVSSSYSVVLRRSIVSDHVNGSNGEIITLGRFMMEMAVGIAIVE